MEHFRQEKKIHTRFAFEIVMGALKVFQQLPTLVDVDIPAGMPCPLLTTAMLGINYVLVMMIAHGAEGRWRVIYFLPCDVAAAAAY